MIDLHCHLLPGVDDGPNSLDESLQMCRLAIADGITHALTTPHIHPGRWDNSLASIRSQVELLRSAVADQGIALQLGFAAEIRLTDELIAQVRDDTLPFLGETDGYRILLLEFPHGHLPPGSEKFTAWLLSRGIRPLIAHPERNKQVMKDVSRIYPFLESGCWLQLTAGSITGHFGVPALDVARHLLDRDLVAVVASDAHNLRSRPPRLRDAFDAVAALYGEGRARRLLIDTPAAICAGQFPNAGEFSSIADVM